jgi:cytochrome c551/c552
MSTLRIGSVTVGLLLLLCGQVSAQQGRAIFEGKGNCWTCHGRDAKGSPLGPNLTDGEWLNMDGSPDSIRIVIQTGVAKPKRYPAPMPPLGGVKLRQAEVEAVAAYVFSLSRPDVTRRYPPMLHEAGILSAPTRYPPVGGVYSTRPAARQMVHRGRKPGRDNESHTDSEGGGLR